LRGKSGLEKQGMLIINLCLSDCPFGSYFDYAWFSLLGPRARRLPLIWAGSIWLKASHGTRSHEHYTNKQQLKVMGMLLFYDTIHHERNKRQCSLLL
jgi:hypothetical protein